MALAEMYSPDNGCAIASVNDLAQRHTITPRSARYYIKIKKLERMHELIVECAMTPDGQHRFYLAVLGHGLGA